MSLIKQIIFNLLACVFILYFWELSVSNEHLRFVLPAPSLILHTLWQSAARFRLHALVTFYEMIGSFFLALLVAFPLAWLMSFYKNLPLLLQPLFVAIQCIPMFALAPIMVLWFGWSYTAIIVPTALMIFFPLTINIYQGLCATPKKYLEFFLLQRATVWQIFWKLQLPSALPHIFSGIRISIALAGICTIAGEWAGAQAGLGMLMLESRRSSDIETTFAALTCLTMMSMSFYLMMLFFEKYVKNLKLIKTRKNLSLFLLLTTLGLNLGCSSNDKDLAQTTLVLDWLPNPNHIPLYVGLAEGFFEKEGLNLKILKLADPSDGIPYLTSKQVDLCLTYMPHTLNALQHAAKVTPIAILIEKPLNCIIFRKGENINHASDLNGKIVGYSVDSYQTRFLETMLKNRHVHPKELRNVTFDLVSTLATKQVDALFGAYWNIEVQNLKSWRLEADFLPLTHFGVPSYYELIVLAQQQNLNPEFVRSFQNALQKSIDYCRSNSEKAFNTYLKLNPDKSLKTANWERQSWNETLPVLAQTQSFDPVLWNTFVDWLVANQLIPSNETVSFEKIFLNGY